LLGTTFPGSGWAANTRAARADMAVAPTTEIDDAGTGREGRSVALVSAAAA